MAGFDFKSGDPMKDLLLGVHTKIGDILKEKPDQYKDVEGGLNKLSEIIFFTCMVLKEPPPGDPCVSYYRDFWRNIQEFDIGFGQVVDDVKTWIDKQNAEKK
jgi:hypothetical protein